MTISEFAAATAGAGPVARWYSPERETVIKGRVPINDDDPLHADADYQRHAKRRRGPWEYPEVPTLQLPSEYRRADDPMPYPPHLVARVGQSGWNYVREQVDYLAYEFDAAGEHKAGIPGDEIELIAAALSQLDYCDLRRSTNGRGLHLRVPLASSVPVPNRAGYAAVLDHGLNVLDSRHGLPFTLRSRIDRAALGRGVLWLWRAS